MSESNTSYPYIYTGTERADGSVGLSGGGGALGGGGLGGEAAAGGGAAATTPAMIMGEQCSMLPGFARRFEKRRTPTVHTSKICLPIMCARKKHETS